MVPLLVAMTGAVMGPRWARRMTPRAATVTLTGLAVSVAGLVLATLVAIAYLAVARTLPGAHPADWNHEVLRRELPLSVALGAGAAAVAAALLMTVIASTARTVAGRRRIARAVRALPAPGGVATPEGVAAEAFCVPGPDPIVVVSRSMLEVLSDDERRVVIAHERAHLRHHHHVYVRLALAAAAANPLLRPVSRAVRTSVERWADQSASATVGDPALTARAIASAALATTATSPVELAAAQHAVVERVAHLLTPPRTRARYVVLVAALITVCWLSAGAAFLHLYTVIEFAETIRL